MQSNGQSWSVAHQIKQRQHFPLQIADLSLLCFRANRLLKTRWKKVSLRMFIRYNGNGRSHKQYNIFFPLNYVGFMCLSDGNAIFLFSILLCASGVAQSWFPHSYIILSCTWQWATAKIYSNVKNNIIHLQHCKMHQKSVSTVGFSKADWRQSKWTLFIFTEWKPWSLCSI